MVPVRCIKCGFAVTLHMTPFPTDLDASFFGYGYDWNCPNCQEVNPVEQAGQVVGLTLGHQGPAPE